MIYAQATAPAGTLDEERVRQTLTAGLEGRFKGQKVLVLIPDHTRSLPLPLLFRLTVEILHDARQLDFMVALGTHPPLSEEQLQRLVGITAGERSTTYQHIGLFNHAWDNPAALTTLGVMAQDEIQQLAGANWHPSLPDEVEIRINKAALSPISARPPNTLTTVTAGRGEGVCRPTQANKPVTPIRVRPTNLTGRVQVRQPIATTTKARTANMLAVMRWVSRRALTKLVPCTWLAVSARP
mgnify:CR=1 FL=1